MPAEIAPSIPDINSLDCEVNHPRTTAPPFIKAWIKQKFKASLGLKSALLYSNPSVNPSAHLWHPIPTSNVKVAFRVDWLPKARHSIKAWILSANWVRITDEAVPEIWEATGYCYPS